MSFYASGVVDQKTEFDNMIREVIYRTENRSGVINFSDFSMLNIQRTVGAHINKVVRSL